MIDHSTADIFLDEEGYVWFKFKQNAKINLQHAYEYIDIIDDICAGKKRCFILDTRESGATASSGNRSVMGSDPQALRWRKADALLVDSQVARVLGNLYMKVNAPNHPVRLFDNEQDAKNWLSQF